MRRFIALISATAIGLTVSVSAITPAQATIDVDMNLDQTILVWSGVNDRVDAGGNNYDIEMSTISTLTGEAAPVGYTFQPALSNDPCPAPYQAFSSCGGPIVSAAMNPDSRATYGLMSGVDSPNSVLYGINPSTGAPTFSYVLTLGDGTSPFGMSGIFFDSSGTLYAWEQDYGVAGSIRIYSVDTSDGVMTSVLTLDKGDFNGRVRSFSYDATGQLWAFSAPSNGFTETYGYRIDLNSSVPLLGFYLLSVTLTDGAFDANGYYWMTTASNELYTLDVTDASTLTYRADIPQYTGALVISDVPFPAAEGVDDGETIAQYAPVTVDISNARASSDYTIEIHSTPVELATGSVAQNGSASVPFEIPNTVPVGDHTLVLTYTAPNGRTVTEEIPVTVAYGLPNTGVDVAGTSLVSITFGMLGLLTLAWVARRRRASRE